MTTIHIVPLKDNKHSCHCDQYEKELKEFKDQLTCLQKSVANLRKDIPELITKRIPELRGRKENLYPLEDKQ